MPDTMDKNTEITKRKSYTEFLHLTPYLLKVGQNVNFKQIKSEKTYHQETYTTVSIKESSWEKMCIFKKKWKAPKMKYANAIRDTFHT